MTLDPSKLEAGGGTETRMNSWKEIARYLNCGVRTVQRWEKTEGLPVRRHVHQTQSTVYAFVPELDRWREARSDLLAGAHHDAPARLEHEGLIGRAAELNRLSDYWRSVQTQKREVVFVTGEIGIGKSKLVRSFLAQLDRDAAWVVEGHCVEQYGDGEAYLPVIEGLARLVRQPAARSAAVALGRYAPSWVAHIPGYPIRQPARRTDGAPQKMAPELVAALEALARDRPVVLFLDDLHWSDWSTAELVDRIARRVESARILMIGTYRTDEVIFRQHPIVRIQHELRVHRRCHELKVPRFAEHEIGDFLRDHGISHHVERAARRLRHWTGGNPLFLDILFEHLAGAGYVTLRDANYVLEDAKTSAPPSIPPTLQDIIEDRLHRLTTTEHRLLDAASVAGSPFSTAAVAAAVPIDMNEIERAFDALASRHQFVMRTGSIESSAGGVAATYEFLHSLYQSVLYARIAPQSRTALHAAIGSYLERESASSREAIAAELAMHFERARDYERAVTYYEAAATTAMSRSADREAHRSAERAFECLKKLPAGPDRDRRELRIRLQICAALSSMSTMSDPRVESAYSDALAVCERIGDEAQLVPALLGIQRFELTRGNVATARAISERTLSIARQAGQPLLLLPALQHLATCSATSGLYRDADVQTQEALDIYDRRFTAAELLSPTGFGPLAALMTVRSATRWILGYPDEAVRLARSAVERAEQLGHPQTLAHTKAWGAAILEWCGAPESREWAESSLQASRELEFPMAEFFAEGVLGWILTRSSNTSGIDLIRKSTEFQSRAGIRLWIPHVKAWLAEALLRAGNAQAAIGAASEGLQSSQETGIRQLDAELHGLWAVAAAHIARGTSSATKRKEATVESERHIRQSLTIARKQDAKSFALRNAIRWVRLRGAAPDGDAARGELSRIYDSYSEGFTTRDLLEARMLLAALPQSADSNHTAHIH